MATGVSIETPRKGNTTNNARVSRLIMVTLQIIVAGSIFRLFRDVLCAHASFASSNIYISLLVCTHATICAYLILMKHQMLIQNFSRDNVQLAERLGARTLPRINSAPPPVKEKGSAASAFRSA